MPDFTNLVQWGARDTLTHDRHDFNATIEERYTFSFTLSDAEDASGHDLEFYLLFVPPTSGFSPKLDSQDRVWIDLEFKDGLCKVWADGTPPNDPSIGHGGSPLSTVAGVASSGNVTYTVDLITAFEGDIEDQSGRNVTADLADEPDLDPGLPPLYIYTNGIFDELSSILTSKGKTIEIHIVDAGAYVPPVGGDQSQQPWGDPEATWGDPGATWASP